MKEKWGMKDRNLLSNKRKRIEDIEKGSARVVPRRTFWLFLDDFLQYAISVGV